MDQCYNCGKPFRDIKLTTEHIPAKNLYDGYPEAYKNNRITVLACSECNNWYSKIDNEIRDIIGITNNSSELQKQLTDKSVRSLLRKSDWKSRIDFSFHTQPTVAFNYDRIKLVHKKHFRALLYHHFHEFFDDNQFEWTVICNGDENDQKADNVANSMRLMLAVQNWAISGHENIFRYKLSAISEINEMGNVKYCNSIKDSVWLILDMIYHDTIWAVVYAIRNETLNHILNSKEND